MKFNNNNCSKSLRQKIDMKLIITVVIFVSMIYCMLFIQISNCKPTQRYTRPHPSYHNNIYRHQGPVFLSRSSNASPRSRNLLTAGSETNQQAFVIVDNNNHNNYQPDGSTIQSLRDTDIVTEVNDEISDNKNNSRYVSASEDAVSQDGDDKYQISEEIVYIDPKTGLQVEEPSAEQLKKFGGKIPEVVVEHVVQEGEPNEEFVEYLEQPNQPQIDVKYNNEHLQQQQHQQQYASNVQDDKQQQIYSSLPEQPVEDQYQMNIPLSAGLDLTVPATILTEIAASFLPTEVLKQLRDDYGVRVVATREQKDAKLTINCEDATINTSVCEKLKRKTPSRTQTNQQQSYEYNQQQQQQQQYQSQENQPSKSADNVENQTASVEFSNLDNASIEPTLLHDVARIDPNTLKPYNIGRVNESSDAYDANSTTTIQGTYNQGYGNADRLEEVTTIKYPSEQQAIPVIQSHQQHYDLVPDSLQQDASAESKRQQLKASDVIMVVNSTVDVGNSSLNYNNNNNNNQTANSTTIPSSEQTTRQVLHVMYLPNNGQHQLINTTQQVKQDSITTSGKIASNDELQTDSSDKKDIKIVIERSNSNVVSKQTTKV